MDSYCFRMTLVNILTSRAGGRSQLPPTPNSKLGSELIVSADDGSLTTCERSFAGASGGKGEETHGEGSIEPDLRVLGDRQPFFPFSRQERREIRGRPCLDIHSKLRQRLLHGRRLQAVIDRRIE